MRGWPPWSAFVQKLCIFRSPAAHGCDRQSARLGAQYVPHVCIAESQRIREDRVEDGREFARRGRYYAEHFRRSGPLLKRLGKVLGSPP